MPRLGLALVLAMACASTVGCARATGGNHGSGGNGGSGGSGGSGGGGGDALDLGADPAGSDLGGGGGGGSGGGGGGGALDLGSADLATTGGGIITGGPCASGATGATAIRVHWIDAAGTAEVQYDAFGLPDHARDKVTAYSASGQTGFTPEFVDPYLGDGGLLLDGSDFVDIALSGSGLGAVDHATLALYGRSFSVDTDGSFAWRSFSDSGASATDFVSNVPPYRWYAADIGNTVAAGDANVLVRVKAGPSSGALVVNRLEICLAAR